MKKLLAIVLSMLMLLTASAGAEQAVVTTLTDPQLTVTQGEQSMVIDMADVTLTLSAGMANGIPTVNVDVFHENDALLIGTLQIAEGRLLLDLESMTNTYCIAMPEQMADTAQQGYNTMFEHLPEMFNMKLPMIPIPTIPKLDIASALAFLLTDAGEQDGGKLSTFTLPYGMINQILEQAMPQIEEAMASIPNSDQITGFLKNMIDSKSGITIEGQLLDKADSAEMVIDFYPVQNDQTSEAAMASLEFDTEENGLFLEAKINQNGTMTPVGDIALTTSPTDKNMLFVISVMNPESAEDELAHFSTVIYPEDTIQYIDFTLAAQGQELDLTFAYGQQDGTDVAVLSAAMPDTFDFSLNEATVDGEDGSKAGSLTVDANADGNQIGLSAGLAEAIVEASLRSVKDAEGAIELQTLTEEQQAQFSQELEAAMGAIMAYINTLEPAAA